jgi:hypothetical protein
MAEREHSRSSKEAERPEVEEEGASPRSVAADQKLLELMDVIDLVLEEIAAEFVMNYLLRGGA